MFLIENNLKQGDALLPLLFNFDLVHAIRNIEESQVQLKVYWTHQLLGFADADLWGDKIRTIKEPPVVPIEEVGLEVNTENDVYVDV
jgi:hypothetical protein